MEELPMIIRDVIWLEEVEEKLYHKHHVIPNEVEYALVNKPYIRVIERGHQPGEDLYAAYGQTAGGRYLTVFSLTRETKLPWLLVREI